MLRKVVLGLGKAGLLPPRRSNGAGPSTNTSHGTHDLNASPQNQITTSVVTDSQPVAHPRPNGNNNLNNLPNLRRNLHHAAASGVTGAPKESEIITIGSPHFKDDEGVGAASAEPLVDIEEASNEKTASGGGTTGTAAAAGGTDDENKKQITGVTLRNGSGAVEEKQTSQHFEGKISPRKKRSRQSKTPSTAAPARKRGRTSATPDTTTNTFSQTYKISDLIGQVVQVPGSVFSVNEPEYYIGDIKKRDSHHKNAVEVAFRDDNSRYWFPLKDVVKWLEEQKQRENQVEVIMEEEEDGAKVEEKEEIETLKVATAAAAARGGDVKGLDELHNIDRRDSMFDEALAAQALTDISASGGVSVTVSVSGGGGGGGGGVSSGKAVAVGTMNNSNNPPVSTGNIVMENNGPRIPSRLRNVAK